MKSRHLVLVLFACSDPAPIDACRDATGACVQVEITGSQAIDHVSIDVAYGIYHDTVSLDATSLPAVTSIRLNAPTTTVVSIVATGVKAGTLVGAGFVKSSPIIDGDHESVTVALDSIACQVNKNYCGGEVIPGDTDTVYRCGADGIHSRGKCAYGCTPVDGACMKQANCISGDYCGGDKVIGDPQMLYTCNNGTPSPKRECGQRCEVRPTPMQDVCID